MLSGWGAASTAGMIRLCCETGGGLHSHSIVAGGFELMS